jgi:antitoxin (DNA-binding transcriptional repressor) of toxin-antitoxin stability system
VLTVTIDVARTILPDLVHRLQVGDKVVITENDHPVARLLPPVVRPERKPRRPGTLRETVLYMAPDFNAPLEEFKEYSACPTPPWN